jgi:hypothetical protein
MYNLVVLFSHRLFVLVMMPHANIDGGEDEEEDITLLADVDDGRIEKAAVEAIRAQQA